MEPTTDNQPVRAELKDDERAALKYAKKVKDFYQGVAVLVILAVIFIAMRGPDPKLLIFFAAFGAMMGLQALFTFEIVRLPFQNFEKRLAEKKLGRKL